MRGFVGQQCLEFKPDLAPSPDRNGPENGAKLIVIDPRRIKEAEKADLWLQIRPGTDLAMLLGWIRLIIAEELYDHDFVAKWDRGF